MALDFHRLVWRVATDDHDQPTRGYESQVPALLTFTVDKRSGVITKVQTWEDRESGLRARAISRTGHTGEILELPGQIVAGLGCLGGVMLVYTGFALSWRRFFAGKRNPVRAAGNQARRLISPASNYRSDAPRLSRHSKIVMPAVTKSPAVDGSGTEIWT